ncbi:MAG: uracil-xanthine permease, partial [Oscillibacter sp.]|nr:uracil-xanthine permease [Oscillibacter sp.]
MKEKNEVGQAPVRDARVLGKPKMFLLGLQHMFAMFGATVLVPAITGLSVSDTLLFAGLGTLLFHLITKRKVPAFLGSSFAFLAAYTTIAPNGEPELLPYACFGVACAGLLYLVIAGLFKGFGADKVMRYFPPIVTGPIIIAIGLCLSGWALSCCADNWGIALVAIVVVIVCNIWGKGMIKIIPILLGIIASYLTAALTHNVDFTAVKDAAWLGLPFHYSNTVFSIFQNPDKGLLLTAVITIVPISIATIMEHIGDISAISSTVGENFIEDPG